MSNSMKKASDIFFNPDLIKAGQAIIPHMRIKGDSVGRPTTRRPLAGCYEGRAISRLSDSTVTLTVRLQRVCFLTVIRHSACEHSDEYNQCR